MPPHRDPAQVGGGSVREVEETRQDLPILLGVEPDEVLVVALDEDGLLRHGPTIRIPGGEVPGALVPSRGTVDPLRIGPHPEVPDVEHPLEAHPKRPLECEDVVVEPIEGSVRITGGAEEHGAAIMPTPGVTASRFGHARPRGGASRSDAPTPSPGSQRLRRQRPHRAWRLGPGARQSPSNGRPW